VRNPITAGSQSEKLLCWAHRVGREERPGRARVTAVPHRERKHQGARVEPHGVENRGMIFAGRMKRKHRAPAQGPRKSIQAQVVLAKTCRTPAKGSLYGVSGGDRNAFPKISEGWAQGLTCIANRLHRMTKKGARIQNGRTKFVTGKPPLRRAGGGRVTFLGNGRMLRHQ